MIITLHHYVPKGKVSQVARFPALGVVAQRNCWNKVASNAYLHSHLKAQNAVFVCRLLST